MRLIDADALIEDIKTKLWDWDTVDGITSLTVLKQTITDINNAPTIDAVPVVRCEECRFSEVFQNDSSGVMARYCNAFRLVRMVADDDFCSYGERKDDDTERG